MPFGYEAGVNDIATTDLAGVLHLVDAARAAGAVDRFVYVSFSKNIDLDFPLRNAKRTVEDHLRLSGLTYTILRPSYFMEVWLSPAVGFDVANGSATIYGAGERPVSWISLEDVAEVAVRSLDSPVARNAVLELGGPDAISPNDVVALFERAHGAPLTVTHVPVEALVAQQEAATDPMQQSFSGLMRCYAAGDAVDMGPLLREMPMELTSVEAHAMATRPMATVG
jgi:NADH dehydrogenase